MNNRVVVLGSCSVCHVFTSPELPARGETLIGDDYHIVVGGKGSGQAVVAQKCRSQAEQHKMHRSLPAQQVLHQHLQRLGQSTDLAQLLLRQRQTVVMPGFIVDLQRVLTGFS